MKKLYQIIDLKFSYRLGTQMYEALHGVSLDIPEADVVCFSGPSGSGKTTFLNVLGLIEPIQSGTVLFDGLDLAKISESQKNQIRRHQIGFVFQQFHLLPILTAIENVELFLARQGIASVERLEMAQEALHSVGLYDHRNKKPSEMSGGQRQRVAIARAIAKTPSVIIADEPTASLDQKTGREIMQILLDLNADKGVTILIASHDQMVYSFAKTHYHMQDGQLLEGVFAC